ncbi:hypothetical protein P885DRAFT_81495 [Corynascus similis CBS 632.67]
MTTIRDANAPIRISWFISQLDIPFEPGEQWSDAGHIDISTSKAEENPGGLVVDATNVTKWFEVSGWEPENNNRWILNWSLRRLNSVGERQTCPFTTGRFSSHLASGELIFDMKSNIYLTNHELEDADFLRNVADIPECPKFGTLVKIGQNETNPGCPPMREVQGVQGNPCAVKIDRSAVADILSKASDLAMPTSTSAACAGPALTLQMVLMAACVLCALAL